MSYDGSEELAYNPFAEGDDEDVTGSHQKHGYYSSAFFPKAGASNPTLRHRRSSSTDKLGAKSNAERKRHLRSRTEIQIVPPNSAGLHPLKSALAGTIGAVFQDTNVTRPHLSRMVNEGNLVDAPSVEDEGMSNGSPLTGDDEKDVIVHQVTPKDSLAGVSLKYGISMANLRRANQLWTSDSIHRRDLLYIPVDQASRAREYIPEPKLISLTPDPSDESGNVFEHSYTSTSPLSESISEIDPPSPAVSVLRVSAKQLSYFPPSSNKLLDITANGHPSTHHPYLQPTGTPRTSPSSNSNRYSPSSTNNPFTSILTALPINASTRDELITRLSLDSVSSSFTDRSRANSDEENGHELGEVAKKSRKYSNNISQDEIDESFMPTPRASQRPPNAILPVNSAPRVTLSSSLPRPSSIARSLSSTSPPQFYISQTQETYIRTSQLEPSPAMQLPNFRSNTVGRSLGRTTGRSLQGTFGIERTPSSKSTNLDSTKNNKDLRIDQLG